MLSNLFIYFMNSNHLHMTLNQNSLSDFIQIKPINFYFFYFIFVFFIMVILMAIMTNYHIVITFINLNHYLITYFLFTKYQLYFYFHLLIFILYNSYIKSYVKKLYSSFLYFIYIINYKNKFQLIINQPSFNLLFLKIP